MHIGMYGEEDLASPADRAAGLRPKALQQTETNNMINNDNNSNHNRNSINNVNNNDYD